MTYYPLLMAPNCKGFTTLCNFPPNNWESCSKSEKLVHVTWLDGDIWKSTFLQKLAFNHFLTVTEEDLAGLVPINTFSLLSLGEKSLPNESPILPELDCPKTLLPNWRGTLGLRYHDNSTSYQGEIEPLPAKGSLLTFSPFSQCGSGILNYLLLLNLVKSTDSKNCDLEIRSCEKKELLKTVKVKTNAINIIDLNDVTLTNTSMPLIICRELTGIPLYFSIDLHTKSMSLEHTHPPASTVIHGNRWAVQHFMKNKWFRSRNYD